VIEQSAENPETRKIDEKQCVFVKKYMDIDIFAASIKRPVQKLTSPLNEKPRFSSALPGYEQDQDENPKRQSQRIISQSVPLFL